MAKSETKSTGWVATRSLSSGAFIGTKDGFGRVQAHGSFGLPNGDRIVTVRKDIMDRALGRNSEQKR
jgi:hypothetical protein